MYHVRIRDHIMIAHSLQHPGFGPAQKMHGATYIVDVTFYQSALDEMNVVLDIGLAHQVLREVLEPLNYQNLDDVPEFQNQLTTTEYLSRVIFDRIALKIRDSFKGKMAVTLGESHLAWAGYEGVVA
ncbi:MAG TPA: 6-carboxytetrahydropterin synthase [Saprospiraceae bacterium]|nr:6-carboxytetrahydropterin synthase [Saprospiraceae bacterium]MCB9270378.1 6-carboxytetrahydropterin synthase [Lewinellaceae bacterium]HPG08537.1 6-carboxytetrahydropterin synthase [Saprospiraceae bacterium]HPR00977.1 6-carboxytetrahydropterin synthase [Saprospiraceae bacterium]HQU51947.1 6-carboxytetrahydropterin synthase [Saprospiraceae bacterium]